jgi:uncharacterized protein (TIGR02266 family)
MSVKTILVAHRLAPISDRFAAALADARHAFVQAGTADAALAVVQDPESPISLALVDLELTEDGIGLVRDLRRASREPLPIVVFSGSISGASQIRELAVLNVAGYINEHASTAQILPALAPHLFPDNFNRRSSQRVPVGVPISYRVGRTIAGAITLDISRGGLAIRTMNPLPLGTAIQVTLRLPGTAAEIEATGRVAWSDRKVGMGVQFDQVSTTDQRVLEAFVDHRP